jgi:hypothetical protein
MDHLAICKSNLLKLGGCLYLSLIHNPAFLGAKSTSIRDCVGPSVRQSVPHDARLRGKLVTSRLLREEEEEEKTDYVAIPLHRDSFTSRFLRT